VGDTTIVSRADKSGRNANAPGSLSRMLNSVGETTSTVSRLLNAGFHEGFAVSRFRRMLALAASASSASPSWKVRSSRSVTAMVCSSTISYDSAKAGSYLPVLVGGYNNVS
jgi:hypothetical protein